MDRLWNKVDKSGECWVWLGSKNTSGYGQIKIDGKRPVVHRVAYELLVGPIPDGLQLDHLCRNRACVNPEHLEPVTPAENVRRGESGSANAAKTHCPQGHAYTPENTYVSNTGGKPRRNCRTCVRESVRRYQRRKRAA